MGLRRQSDRRADVPGRRNNKSKRGEAGGQARLGARSSLKTLHLKGLLEEGRSRCDGDSGQADGVLRLREGAWAFFFCGSCLLEATIKSFSGIQACLSQASPPGRPRAQSGSLTFNPLCHGWEVRAVADFIGLFCIYYSVAFIVC